MLPYSRGQNHLVEDIVRAGMTGGREAREGREQGTFGSPAIQSRDRKTFESEQFQEQHGFMVNLTLQQSSDVLFPNEKLSY